MDTFVTGDGGWASSVGKPAWRLGLGALLAVLIAGLAACGGDESSEAASDEPFVIGLAAAKSGFASFFDEAPSQGLELRIDQINEEGGVAGQPIELISGDTQSDPGKSTAVASQLIEQGADLLAVTCDFDLGAPAAIAANSQGIPAISLCASDQKFGDKTTIGPFAFTMGTGTDALGSLAAEYAYNDEGWRTAYLLQDTSGEYTKSLGEYFQARWDELGGQIVGTDTYNGLESEDVGAQVTKLRSLGQQPDFIYLPAFTPPGVSVIKQIREAGIDTPIISAEALDYPLLPKVVGNSTDIYSIATAGCLAYCKGQHGDDVNQFVSGFKAKFGKEPDTSFTLGGYELVTVVAEALNEQPDARGEDLVEALEEVEPGSGLMEGVAFSPTCHKPTQRVTSILELVNGQFVEVDRRAVSDIPDIGDNNPCAD